MFFSATVWWSLGFNPALVLDFILLNTCYQQWKELTTMKFVLKARGGGITAWGCNPAKETESEEQIYSKQEFYDTMLTAWLEKFAIKGSRVPTKRRRMTSCLSDARGCKVQCSASVCRDSSRHGKWFSVKGRTRPCRFLFQLYSARRQPSSAAGQLDS